MPNFKKLRSLSLTHEEQGMIYFTCQSYPSMPIETRQKIDRLCEEIGRCHRDALFEFITTRQSAYALCCKYYIGSETTLYNLRHRFYEKWSSAA